MTTVFIFQHRCVSFLTLHFPKHVHDWYPSCESCSWAYTHWYLLLRSDLFGFVYWGLSGLDNGEMGLLILSAHGATTVHSSLVLMGWPISSQLMQEVVGWGFTGSSVQLLWCLLRTGLGSGVDCLRPIHMLSAQKVQRWRNIHTHSAHPLNNSNKQLSINIELEWDMHSTFLSISVLSLYNLTY